MVRVGLIQLNSGNEVSPNLDVIEAYIRKAHAGGAEFITTPETSHLMEMNRKAVLEKAKPETEDEGVRRLSCLAAELKIWLHVGSLIIKVGDEKLANRAFLFSPDGKLHAKYDKLHLFDVNLPNGETYRESRLYRAGEKAVVSKTPLGTFGISICYDLRFPHLYRDMADKGATILLIPAAFTQKTGEAHWHTLMKARAVENGCFVIAAAQTDLHATGRSTYGHSLVVDPWGEVLADGGTEAGVTIVDIDLAKVDETRQIMPSLEHTRRYEFEAT